MSVRFEYKIVDNQVHIAKYLGPEGEKGLFLVEELEEILKVPEEIEGLPVTRILEEAFLENGLFLSEIHIPKTVSQIDGLYLIGGVLLVFDSENPWYHSDGFGVYQTKISDDGSKEMVLVSVRPGDPRRAYRVEDGTTMLADDCCSGLDTIEEMWLPDSVRVIGEAAFMLCDSLSRIHLNEGLEEIRKDAFSKCPSLQEIHLPSTLTRLSETALTASYDWDFQRPGLCHITVAEGNPLLFTNETGLYQRLPVEGQQSEHSCKLIKYLGQEQTVIVPDYVSIIGAGAYRRKNLLGIVLHKGIQEIHEQAFYENPLRQVEIERDQLCLYIPAEPFLLRDEVISFFDFPLEGYLYGYDRYDQLADEWKFCKEKVKMLLHRLQDGVALDHLRADSWRKLIAEHIEEVVTFFAEADDLPSVRLLLDLSLISEYDMDQAIEICNSRGRGAIVGLLMDYKNTTWGNQEFDFSL